MLAYHPGIAIQYQIAPTLLSVVLAVAVTWISFWIAVRYRAPLVGGAVMGAAIAVMHYTGMAALSVPRPATLEPYLYRRISILVGGGALRLLGLSLVARNHNLHNPASLPPPFSASGSPACISVA